MREEKRSEEPSVAKRIAQRLVQYVMILKGASHKQSILVAGSLRSQLYTLLSRSGPSARQCENSKKANH